MLKKIDIKKALNRKKVWDLFGFYYSGTSGIGGLRNNHSLNCGCQFCKFNTFRKRQLNRINRHRIKINIKKIDIND